MGQAQTICGQNILNQLVNQYGGDALKFITAQKSKYFIEDKFTQLQRKFHQSFHQFENSLKQLTQTKTSQITTAFQGLKNKANSLLPGGIATLQRVKGQSINDFSGFASILSKIQSIKSQALSNLLLKKQQMMSKLNQQKSLMTQNIQKSKPNIPLYDQIPQTLRRQLFKQAQQKFSKELGSNQKDLQTKILGLFNASALQKMFQQMSPQGILDKLLAQGFGILEKNIFSNITGGAGGIARNFTNLIGNNNGGFGNFIGNIIR